MTRSVRLTTDKDRIEAFLRRDPVYAAYAIGDLEPEQFPFCTWALAEVDGQPSALALFYRRLKPPVLLTLGDAQGIAAVFAEVALPPQVYMAAQVAHLPIFLTHYDFDRDRIRPMVRMAIAPGALRPADSPAQDCVLRRLSPADVPAIEALYACGGPFAPDAFSPLQVAEGVFYGALRRTASHTGQDALLAVAGTHLVAPTFGVAAVGNIYTHPAQRGKGLGRLVTQAVTQELLDRGLLVVLNVDTGNATAGRLYESLGFRVHCSFVEGIGSRPVTASKLLQSNDWVTGHN